MPGSGTINISGPILGGGGKGGLRGVLPNIFSGMGGFGTGGGFGMAASTMDPRKKRFAGGAPAPGDATAPTSQPSSSAAWMTPGMQRIIGRFQPQSNPQTNLQPNPLGVNIYENYPAFNPEYRGDQLGGIEKQRGAGPETLQRLNEGALRYRGRGPSFRGGVGGPGMGFGENDPIKKLLMARYGGM